VYVCDDRLQRVPPGEAGEVYVAGGGLAVGYLARPGATGAAFLPDPTGSPGSRMYRTGDLGRWNPQGKLEILGRIDDQLKVRGFRIDPGEVEATLRGHDAVLDCAVAMRPLPSGEPHLAAFYTTGGAPADPDELRRHLRRTLPDHMVPASFTVLDAMPLTMNGKLDRSCLPAAVMRRTERADQHGYPSEDAALMAEVAATWTDVLGVEAVQPTDDFFLLGGHSLTAVRVLHLLRERLKARLTLQDILDARDLVELTRTVRERLATNATAEPPPSIHLGTQPSTVGSRG
jgi:acyl carrier protein